MFRLVICFSTPRKWGTISYKRPLRNLVAPFCISHTQCSIPFYQLVSRFFTPTIEMQLPVNCKKQAKSRHIKRRYFLIPYWLFSTDPILEKASASIRNALGNTSSLVSLGRHLLAALSCLRLSVARNAATRQCALNTSLHSHGRFPSSKAANRSLVIPTRSTRPMVTYPG